MKQKDKQLGMHRSITRRDILQGMGALTAGATVAGLSSLNAMAEPLSALAKPAEGSTPAVYPPALMGIRGNHDGAFEVAHQMGRYGRRDWGNAIKPDAQAYDLVVVGAGISGLSAAHFYRQQHPQARILLLDNHDDFGGHAKRNEFHLGDRMLLAHGGSQSLQEPSGYSAIVKGLLRDLNVDLNRFEKAYDQQFYQRHGLRAGFHFNKAKWGADQTVPFDLLGFFEGYLPAAQSELSLAQAVQMIPISAAAQAQLLGLITVTKDQLPEVAPADKVSYLNAISYRDFLHQHMAITEAEVFELLQDLPSDAGVGIDACSAYRAITWYGLPGWGGTGLPTDDSGETEPYIHHFPDGNASIARLLVRSMIPRVATGNSMDDIVTAAFDYAKLDQPNAAVRLRLNSTVTEVKHIGNPPRSANGVELSYVHQGQAYRVKGRACVMACNNSMIPYLCPELPAAQKKALSVQVRRPILYTSVALRNWQAFKKLGLAAVYSPGSYHIHTLLNFPVSLGDYDYAGNPDEPVVVHMERFLHVRDQGLTQSQQSRLARQELMSTSFETIEREVRKQLLSLLGAGGFDPAKDIEGITVNRWAHGYAYNYNSLFDQMYADRNDARYPHVIGRQPFGRISIANSDAASNAMLEAAVEQAYRAVNELVS